MKTLLILTTTACLSLTAQAATAFASKAPYENASFSKKTAVVSTRSIDWESFLAQHDMMWTKITADPTGSHFHNGRTTGYYAGALMGNGLLGTNFYKLKDNVYRLNVGRSDVTEARQPYNLFNSARLPIGYFTLATAGKVKEEEMRLSLFNAQTQGTLTTELGNIKFKTYVHALKNIIVFETDATKGEADYAWNFVPQKAISPRYVFGGSGCPEDYANHRGKANPDAFLKVEGNTFMLVQPLAADSSFQTITRYYVVGWKEMRHGLKRRILATVSQQPTLQAAIDSAKYVLNEGTAIKESRLENSHLQWWHNFYERTAFVSMPDARFESFYWAQCYKFASTARTGKPIVDLQGVWPTYDTTWPAIWMNLNIQLTYSWLTKANLRFLEQPLWDAFWNHRDNLTRNVTDIPGQESWTDSRAMPRSATYDLLSPLDPKTVETNQYEVGNLTWTLFYYWQQCMAYGDTLEAKTRLFPLLKSAVNLFFHIRRQTPDGHYGLPPTASPEYVSKNIGTNSNYDLANLRWGLQTLISLNDSMNIGDPMRPAWQDFLDNLVDFPYSQETGFKVSDKYEFTDTSHRHYSHLFMIYPYHLLSWENPQEERKMSLSVDRWQGNQGYSRTGKCAMLATKGDGDGALRQMQLFFKNFLRPNTLYNETGPVIETPFSAMSSLHEFFMQDWGGKIRVFFGCPPSWQSASFINLRAQGAFLVSANREGGKTTFIQIVSEKGGRCRLQTGIADEDISVTDAQGKPVAYTSDDSQQGVIEVTTKPGGVFQVRRKNSPLSLPHPIQHPQNEAHPFGDGTRLHQ